MNRIMAFADWAKQNEKFKEKLMYENEKMQAPELGAGQQQCCGLREKTWAECSIEDKIERLRETLRSLRRLSAAHSEAIADVRQTVLEHDHLGERVVVPARPSYGQAQGYGSIGRDPLE